MTKYEVNFKDFCRKSVFKCVVEAPNVFMATQAAFDKLNG